MGELDAAGNANVSHLGGKLVGPGGFIEISQGAKKVVFCGAYDAKGSKVAWRDGKLRVEQPGAIHKLVPQVPRIPFSGKYAVERKQQVLYITGRAVFELTAEGVRLTEVAPGIDVHRDILPHMDFVPLIGDVKPVDAACFR